MKLLQYIGQLTSENDRIDAAKQLARFLKADDLIIFIPDHQLQVLLPGPGFPQSLPNGQAWKRFFTEHVEMTYQGVVPYPDKDSMSPALAVRALDGCVAVLIGGRPAQKEIQRLQEILPIVTPLLNQEQVLLAAQSKAVNNARATEKAERLATTLDEIRHNLMRVLAENTQLLKITTQQNEELATANEEILTSSDELNNANLELKRINADLDNFIYTASHDLKAPISNIEGLVKILIIKLRKYGWEEENTKKILELIMASVERFKATIGDLTEVIKIGKETGEQEGKVNLAEVIQDVKLDLEGMILESEAHIKSDIDFETDVAFSRKNLKSIVHNLLSNAIKYRASDRPPTITLSWTNDSEYRVLTVRDNGLGMDTTNKDKIFGMFKRLHTHVEGTGIGLYIVRRIIENAGGKIEVESQSGIGSTFRVYFKS